MEAVNAPIVASGCRGNAKNECVKIELSQTGVFDPINLLEVGGLGLGLDDGLALGFLLREALQEPHLDDGSTALKMVRLCICIVTAIRVCWRGEQKPEQSRSVGSWAGE